MPELLKTSTITLPRWTAGLIGFCGVLATCWGACSRTRCCWLEVGVTSRSVGGVLRVAKSVRPAMATATMERIATGEGKATPRWSRSARRTRPMSDLEAEPTGGALALTGGAEAAEPADQQRVGGERLVAVDQRVQHLVVPGRAHVELLADRGLLGSGVLPPLTLEGEDRLVALAQLDRGARLIGGMSRGMSGVHDGSC